MVEAECPRIAKHGGSHPLRLHNRELPMPNRLNLVAWIEPQGDRYIAAFVSEKTRWLRAPATRLFRAAQEARSWVEQEAAALGGVPIVWVDSLGLGH
jgi:hypothetical protein